MTNGTWSKFELDACVVPSPNHDYIKRHADLYFKADGILEVWPNDLKTYRKAVYRYAQYFHREKHYDFVQYEDPDGRSDYKDEFENRAFLFVLHDWNLKRERTLLTVGACCFRARKYKGDADSFWALAMGLDASVRAKQWAF